MNRRTTLLAVTLCAFKSAVLAQAPPKFDPAAVARGKQTFVSSCAFCHGANPKGGEKGPDLLRSVLVLHDEAGNSIGQVVLNGRPGKGMPAFPFTSAQISDIAAFLHSSIAAAEDRDSYKILNIVVGDPRAGAVYFNNQCASCHSATGDLKGIASKYDPSTLQGKFIAPDLEWTEGAPPHKVLALSVTVTLPSGESFSGTPLNLDDFNVSLRDRNGDLHSFDRSGGSPKVEQHNRLQAHMDLLSRYTDDDIHNLTAYLVTLK
ncbi:MAG: c-type cytochrome [Acidobacteriaceae bacterium]|nr:c-type cytochrome [Acidobacteriaceae bacterium]